MKAAILVIDLVQDVFWRESPLSRAALEMIPRLNAFLAESRDLGAKVIFATDSFLEGDFIFQGRMKPHAIRGTKGAEPAEQVERLPEDVWLPKRRFSAFFKTDLDQTLRLWGMDLVAVTGVTTNICVLSTALDAVANDFRSVIIEDLCAATSLEIHRSTLDIYRRMPLDPLFRLMTAAAFLGELRTPPLEAS
ncbi:MAG: isochorismatase family cysteine hydrolase [Pseudomonadota bacterium]